MNKQLITSIINEYGYTIRRVGEPQKGYRNQAWPVLLEDGRTVNLIIFKREQGIVERIKRADAVAETAARSGLPVRIPIDPRIIRLNTEQYARLYNYLPGATIPWEAYTMKHIKLLGKTMGELHACLAADRVMSYELRVRGNRPGHSIALDPFHSLPRVSEEYLVILRRMKRYFAGQNVQGALREKLGISVNQTVFPGLEKLLKFCGELPDQQPLHMDFVRSNILFESTDEELNVSGVIDFEKAAFGNPIFDVARTLAFLLVDCKYKTPEKVWKYFLTSGYQKGKKLGVGSWELGESAKNKGLLEALIDLFLFYDFYKFLRHNPYENLPQNEHFTRTKTTLENSNLLSIKPSL